MLIRIAACLRQGAILFKQHKKEGGALLLLLGSYDAIYLAVFGFLVVDLLKLSW